MKRKKPARLYAVIITVVMIITGTAFFMNGGFPTPGPGNQASDTGVATVEAAEGTVTITVDTVASAEAFTSRTFRAVSGGIIEFIAREGNIHSRGDIIFSFDTEGLDRAAALAEIAYKEARLNQEKAESVLGKARKNLSDREVLFASGAVSREQVETAREGVESALFALRSSELSVEKNLLNLQTARREQADGTIRAPFDGTVLKTYFEPGDWAGENSQVLLFGDLSRLRFLGEVDEYDIGRIEQGMGVTITADSMPDTSLQARVERISPQAEVVSSIAVFTVSAAATNPELRLKPGMSADMTIHIASDSGIVVPGRSVSTVRGRSYVEVLKGDEVETRRVVPGASDGVRTVILEGLEAGELVVIPDQPGVLPGLTPAEPAGSNGTSIIPMTIPGGGSSAGGAPTGGGGGGGGGR